MKLGGGINRVIKSTGKKIMEDLSVFPFDFKYHIHFERPQLNESEDDEEKKIQKNLTVLRKLISMFDYSEVCDMWVEYDYEDGDYIIRSKMSTKNHNTAALEKEFEFLEDSIESFGFTNCYVFRPYYVENCENELNESEDGEEKKIQKNLKAIRHLLDTIDVDGLCEMWVEYNPEDGDYEIRSKTTKKYLDMADMVRELGYVDDTIRSWGMKTYVYSPWYVENCEDEVEFMNESEEKKPKLLSTIEEDGLFQMMQDTGLSLPQIYTKTGELPREVLEGYIKDFIKQEGYHQTNGSVQLGYEVEILHNIYINHFYMVGDKVTVEIIGYNDYNEQTDGHIESLSNLTDEEIFTIVENMIKWITYSEM